MIVEDDPNDRLLLKRAFKKLEYPISIEMAVDGEDALSILEGSLSDENDCPEFIILDLKLPGKSGFDVLEWIKDKERLKHIPVIILSSSSQRSDIYNGYSLGANSYLVKPVEHDELVDMVRTIKDYWLDLNHSIEFKEGQE